MISGGKAVAKPTVPRVLSLSQLFTVKEAAKLYASRVLNPIQNFQMPDIPVSPIVQSVEDSLASEFHRRLTEWITDFDSALDNEHEVGVRLVTFGQTVVFHLKNIGYWNPSLITFAGITDNDEPVELIQHVSQISILLMRLPRRNPEEPKQPIGFHAIRQAQEEQ